MFINFVKKEKLNKENNNTISIPTFWKPEGSAMMYNRKLLPPDHPDHEYNYVKNTLGVEPELYGIFHPFYEKYKDYNVDQLRSKLDELEIKNLELERQLNILEQML